MANWLVKTEPGTYAIDDLRRDGVTRWDNIRNYQARNFLRSMRRGDLVLIYHSNAEPPGVAGIAQVAHEAYADPNQFDRKSDYFDPKATKDNPRWFSPDLKFKKKFKELVEISRLRAEKNLGKMLLLQRGSRLSVTPVTDQELSTILKLADE